MCKIPLVKNTFIEEELTKNRLCEFIMSTKKFSMGDKCAEFEDKFAKYQGCKHAVLFSSGGAANLALLMSLKNLGILKNGSRVGFSTLTWSTNVMPIIQLGMIPVAIDIDINTLNVMSYNLQNTINTTKIDAFFTTNVLGFAGDLDKIKKICQENGIIFIEDNCESLGAEVNGVKTGNFGLASTFSFFVAHHLSTIEGGMVCTNDNELYEMLKLVRANGWDRNLSAQKQENLRISNNINWFNAKYSFYDLAFNLRPTEITGFLGCEQLKYLDDNIQKRRKSFLTLQEFIKSNKNLIPIQYGHMTKISPFAFVVLCNYTKTRDTYLRLFADNDIETRPVIAGNIQNQPFFSKYAQHTNTPNAEFVSTHGFYCGNCPEYTEKDLAIICNVL